MTRIRERILITISSAVLHRVRVPFIEPFRISNGVVAEKDAILVELTTAQGVVGWGEASPMSGSFYSAATPDSSWAALKEMVPRLLSVGALDPTRFYEVLRQEEVDPFAKAGLEGALWDAYANTKRKPLYELFGIKRRAVPSGVAIGIFETIDQLLERVSHYVKEGYQRVKIKIQPGWDVEPVATIRAQFPELPLMVDANAAYQLDDVEIFRELDQFKLMMIEQPLAAGAVAEAGELQSHLQTPLCADESAESLAALSQLITNQAARIINIKVQRVGGLSEALLMLKAARSAGLQCWVGTMPELGIASAQALHLAMHSEFSFPTDIEASSRWYVDDIIEPAIAIDERGFIEVPPGVGTGFTVSGDKVDRYTTAVERFSL
ncbi:MAG TPA: o-succinylbenzoate synthase [Pyrinomonadaceae bacterium]|nr:o-succinylbenzoate synthase [Pyrinomonadaceae bacterium]